MDEKIRERMNEGKRREDYARLRHALLELFAEKSSRKEYLDQVVELLQSWSGCCCVGIRVLDEYGNIPYESYSGFSHAFWESESHLSIHKDHCACIRVISERPESHDSQAITPWGSFHTDDLSSFFSRLSAEELKRFRGTCIQAGFASVAIIPLRYRNAIQGAIHLADERKGKVPRPEVEFIESLTPLIGEAIHRFNLEEQVQRDRETQKVISSLMGFSLEDIPLEELLRRDLEFIVSLPWLSPESKGAIYLVEDEPGVLVRKVQFGLSGPTPAACARIPIGQCLCGQAAQERKMLFVDHYHRAPGGLCQAMGPHGHYCVPLLLEGAVLGVIDLFLPAAFRDDERKREFLATIARVLVSTIQRKRTEETLRESEKELRRLSSQLLDAQEKERKWIAQELHDSIGQSLAAIKFSLERKIGQMSGGKAPPGVSLEDILSIVRNGIEETRRIMTNLRPSILDDLGIVATLSWFCREFQKVYPHIQIRKEVDIGEKEVPERLKIVIFRVLQEAMNNMAKHSQGDLIRVFLARKENQIVFAVQDNGVGFDLETSPRGLGLASIKERADYSGGIFTLESGPGKGTRVQVVWPT